MTDGLTTSVLGRTGLDVTKLGYGAMALRESSDDVSERVLNAVLDAGITFIDTSNDYGHSEEMIGKYVSGRRSEYYLATKCGCPPAGGDHVWTRENLFRGLHESLERLKTDYVDIMQLHNAKLEDVDRGGLVDALEEMREQGKVRWIGASAVLPSITTFVERGAFDEYQIPYSALDRAHEEAISDAARSGAGTVIRGGVQQGEPGVSSKGHPDRWTAFDAAGLDDLRSSGESRTAFMLRYTLAHPGLHTTIVGTQNMDHLQENLEAAEHGPLPQDTYAEAKRRLQAVETG
jgi:aryl-alcohol dehydrogenase-like predicted oxidoreductase